MRERISKALAASPGLLLPLWAVTMAFTTYFCMYAFRKPFSAGSYEGLTAFGGMLELKTTFVIAQIIGYTLSKYAGIKVCAELKHSQRLFYLFAAVLFAEAALFGFAVLPTNLKIFAIFLNGLPLGMVWGFLVSYLEGRRTSEVLLAGMSCSYIIASGMVKDAGLWIMETYQVSEYWMPFITGLAFLPVFALSASLLNWTPPPNAEDIIERVQRTPMTGHQRIEFFRKFFVGLTLLLVVYFGLTAYRDFRDNYGVELFSELGYGEKPGIFTYSELYVSVGVLACLVPIAFIHNNRRALMAVFGMLLAGCVLIGGATALLQAGQISGVTWMILIGLGCYMAYVPYGSVLFDRVVAATRTAGTAVFAIYLTDAVGYTGSTFLQLYKDLMQSEATRLQFFIGYSYFMAIAGGILLFISYWDFANAAKKADAHAAQHSPLEPALETE
ncbi:MAG: hypothetical protein GC168_00255 [Candidatus Hydrogenedens sp.]|nr:hypothetical protein [Candidatus Hydrogenedens sp.]